MELGGAAVETEITAPGHDAVRLERVFIVPVGEGGAFLLENALRLRGFHEAGTARFFMRNQAIRAVRAAVFSRDFFQINRLWLQEEMIVIPKMAILLMRFFEKVLPLPERDGVAGADLGAGGIEALLAPVGHRSHFTE